MLEDFREKLQRLQHLEFESHDRHDWLTQDLSDEDLERALRKMPAPELFLGRYSADDIRSMFNRHGFMQKLEQMGFADIKIDIRTEDVYNHRLYVYFDEMDYDHILIELRLREGYFRPREQFVPEMELESLSMIMVDWCLLQNPKRPFDENRRALPQQDHPGLGLLQQFIPVFMDVIRETGRSGVLDVPIHYHGALFYSAWFRFFNPEMEGKFLAMKRDLGKHPLHMVSHGIDLGCLIDANTGERTKWLPGEQILPLSNTLIRYFDHPTYVHIRDKAYEEAKFELDVEECEARMKSLQEEKGSSI